MSDDNQLKIEFGRRHRPEINPPPVKHKSISDFPAIDLNQPLIRKMGLHLGLWTLGTVAVLTVVFGGNKDCQNSNTSNLQNCRSSGSHIGGGGGYGVSNRASGFGGFGGSGIGHGGGG
jgi:hypothetical protein